MIVNKQNNYSLYSNPDTNLLSNQICFSLFEHTYFECSKEVTTVHSNKRFNNTNLIYYIIEGGGTILLSDRKIPIVPGKIYFFPCVKPENYTSVVQPDTKKVQIQFQCNLYSNQDIFADVLYPQCLEDTHHLIPIIKETVLSKNPGTQVLLSPLIQLSIAPLFKLVEQSLSEQLIKGKKYSTLFDYINHNLYIDLTTEKLAKETGFSVYSLTHTIPKEMGFTFKKYITNRILRLVCLDLIYTETLIRNIAFKYHFSTEGYFSDWFFKLTEKRPKEYRQKFRSAGNYSFYQNHI